MHNSPDERNFSLEKHMHIDEHVDELEYEEMELLERLETLREDMEDLGITTFAELIQRIEEMHRRLDTGQNNN